MLIRLAQSKLPAASGDRLCQLVMDSLMVVESGFGAQNMIDKNLVETGLNYMTAVTSVLKELRV